MIDYLWQVDKIHKNSIYKYYHIMRVFRASASDTVNILSTSNHAPINRNPWSWSLSYLQEKSTLLKSWFVNIIIVSIFIQKTK